jgi:hypothetical protein
MTAYYLHIDFRTASGALAWFDGVVEAPNLQAAVSQAEKIIDHFASRWIAN